MDSTDKKSDKKYLNEKCTYLGQQETQGKWDAHTKGRDEGGFPGHLEHAGGREGGREKRKIGREVRCQSESSSRRACFFLSLHTK